LREKPAEKTGFSLQKMKRKLDKRILQPILIFIVSLVLLKLFLTNFFFHLEEIEIQGRVSLSVDQLLQPFDSYWNQNIFALPLDAVEAYYYENLPIRSVHFKRVLPGKIFIKIEEDLPILMTYVDNKFYEISTSGKVLSNQAQLKGVPILVNIGHIYQENNILNEKILAAIQILTKVRRTMPSFFDEIAELEIDGQDVYFYIPNFQKKAIFSLSNFDEALNRFSEAFAQLQTERFSIIDLRYEQQIILRKGTLQ